MQNLHLVFSKPPAGLDDGEYNRWYDRHLHEILRTPGYVAARRYGAKTGRGGEPPAAFPYLSLYETTGDLGALRRDLAAERPNMDLPEWFGGIEFASWAAVDLGGEGGFATPEHLYMVFTREPDHLSTEGYEDWYRDHQEQNVAQAGALRRGWRFHLEREGTPPGAAAPAGGTTYLALYELDGTVEAMNDDLGRGAREGKISLPDWFRLSANVEATAIGQRVDER